MEASQEKAIASRMVALCDRLAAKLGEFGSLRTDEVNFLIDALFTFAAARASESDDSPFMELRHYLATIEAPPQGRQKMRPSLRFAVLRRDQFTCRYCGCQAPNVQLEVDHLLPVSQGGDDAIGNLVTACWDCNRGKSHSSHLPSGEM